jgi:hypothetical protein
MTHEVFDKKLVKQFKQFVAEVQFPQGAIQVVQKLELL